MKGLKGYGFFIVMAAIILVVILSNGFFENMNREHYSYVQFQEDISNGSIRSVIIRQNQEVPTGEVVASTSDNKSKSFYVPDVNTVLSGMSKRRRGIFRFFRICLALSLFLSCSA